MIIKNGARALEKKDDIETKNQTLELWKTHD